MVSIMVRFCRSIVNPKILILDLKHSNQMAPIPSNSNQTSSCWIPFSGAVSFGLANHWSTLKYTKRKETNVVISATGWYGHTVPVCLKVLTTFVILGTHDQLSLFNSKIKTQCIIYIIFGLDDCKFVIIIILTGIEKSFLKLSNPNTKIYLWKSMEASVVMETKRDCWGRSKLE